MRPNYRQLTEPILRRASGCPGLGFIDPVGRRDGTPCGALNGDCVVEARTSQASAESGKDRLINADKIGELAAPDVVRFEVMLELVHAAHFAQCARNGQA